MTGDVVTLATGEVVSTCSDEWRQEGFKRWQDVLAMRVMGIEGRRAKLAAVEAQQGPLARTRLEDEFRKDWQARKEQKA